MTQQDVIADIEDRARKVKISIKQLCGMADVHPTSFSRWKVSDANPSPVGANMQKIEALYGALERLEAKAA